MAKVSFSAKNLTQPDAFHPPRRSSGGAIAGKSATILTDTILRGGLQDVAGRENPVSLFEFEPYFCSKNQRNMVLEIPDSVVQEIPMSPAEIMLEVAIWLYQRKRLSLGQARKLADLSVVAFQKELAERGLYLNYDMEDLQNDLRASQLLA